MSYVRNLWCMKGKFTLKVSEWEILDQGVTVLSGPSGSGKTTLLNCLMGLESCSYEWIDEKGKDWNKKTIAERDLSVVFQDLKLFPHLTAFDNVAFVANARRLSRKLFKERYEYISDRLAIQSIMGQKAGTLSGGEQQRVALLRALVVPSKLWIFDEPFHSLDEKNREAAMIVVREMMETDKVPLIMVSHNPLDWEGFSGKISFIGNGKIFREISL